MTNIFNVSNRFSSKIHKDSWAKANNGILTFCLINFVFEIVLSDGVNIILPVIVNYVISAWYISAQIKKNRYLSNSYWIGLGVSAIIFLVRLIIGTTLKLIAG